LGLLNPILHPIDDAVAWVITGLFNLFGPVFGPASGVTWLLTIVCLVMLMRLIMVPLFIKQMHTQRAMTALSPKITELRKRYKGDRETLNAEMMKLYQEAGVNPLMGCLPLLLQMPLFFALFSVLRYIADWKPVKGVTVGSYHLSVTTIQAAQHAKIFGAHIYDKVLFVPPTLHVPVWPAKVVIILFVVASMSTTYLTMRQNVKRGIMPTGKDNPMGQQQQLMTYVMPLFALSGLFWQFGLVIYWVTTNLWTLGQQFILLRRYPVGAAVLGTATGGAAGGGTGGRGVKPATATGFAPGSGRKADKPRQAGPAGVGGQKGARGPKPDSAGEPPQGDQAASAASGGADVNGHKPAAGEGGVLRRFGRGKAEPPPAPAEPTARVVRQQRQRQSRSKRQGKR
jgi:YidC/Oxa1 family membrane protein insertase